MWAVFTTGVTDHQLGARAMPRRALYTVISAKSCRADRGYRVIDFIIIEAERGRTALTGTAASARYCHYDRLRRAICHADACHAHIY